MNKNGLFRTIIAVALFMAGIGLIHYSAKRGEQYRIARVKELTSYVDRSMEYAYCEGQKNALEGDIRIAITSNGWHWTKSPWDGGKRPAFGVVGYDDPFGIMLR